jgi:hypothetical protein
MTAMVLSSTAVSLTAGADTTLLSPDPSTITGNGHSFTITAYSASTSDATTQISVLIDGAVVATGVAGSLLTAITVIAAGSHTVSYRAYAFNAGTKMTSASLVIHDLGM